MIHGLLGAESNTYQLRGGLTEAMDTHRPIAARVANAQRASSRS